MVKSYQIFVTVLAFGLLTQSMPASAKSFRVLSRKAMRTLKPGKQGGKRYQINKKGWQGGLTLRRRTAESVLGRKITGSEMASIEIAHFVGTGEKGKNGKAAGIGNYTVSQLRSKVFLLKLGGLKRREIRKLVEAGVVGANPEVSEGTLTPLADNLYDRLGLYPDASFAEIQKSYRDGQKKFAKDSKEMNELRAAYDALSSQSSRDSYDLIAVPSQLVAARNAKNDRAAQLRAVERQGATLARESVLNSMSNLWEEKIAELPSARRQEIEDSIAGDVESMLKNSDKSLKDYKELFEMFLKVKSGSGPGSHASEIKSAQQRADKLMNAFLILPGVLLAASAGEKNIGEFTIEEYVTYAKDLASFESYLSYNVNLAFVDANGIDTYVNTFISALAKGLKDGAPAPGAVDKLIEQMTHLPQSR